MIDITEVANCAFCLLFLFLNFVFSFYPPILTYFQ
jgi:hypothetical protein